VQQRETERSWAGWESKGKRDVCSVAEENGININKVWKTGLPDGLF
jgi:hypothetical protein